jgi:hypothetical protein
VVNQIKLNFCSSSFDSNSDLTNLTYMNQETMLDNSQFENESTIAHIAQASPITVFININQLKKSLILFEIK